MDGKLSFLDIETYPEKRKFVGTVYRKPTFSGVYTHFESFLSTAYKFGMVYTLAYRCFKICSDWTKFQEELKFFEISFFKTFVDKFIKKTYSHMYPTYLSLLLGLAIPIP